jgi:hypothetical protein
MQEVLYYRALQTGMAWLAASLTSISLVGLSQALVTRIGLLAVPAIIALVRGRTVSQPPARSTVSTRPVTTS